MSRAYNPHVTRVRSGSVEAIRRQALHDLDALIEVTAEARRDLRSYQTALERNRRNLAQGGRASDIAMFNVRAVRATTTERLKCLERARNASRRSLWRLHAAQGETIADIARTWGLSRQLVSREVGHGNTQRDD